MAEEDPWAAYSPLPEAPPQEPVEAPRDRGIDFLGRGRFLGELVDPRVRDRLIAYTAAEVGGQGREAEQAFIETSFNRSVARNQPLATTLSGSYFPDVTHRRAARRVSDAERSYYGPIIDDVLYGSNITDFATGNASGTVGFAGGPMTRRYGGEKFGIEGPDIGWWRKVTPQLYSARAQASPQEAGGAPSETDPWARYFQPQEAPTGAPAPPPTAPKGVAPPAAPATGGEADPWAKYFAPVTAAAAAEPEAPQPQAVEPTKEEETKWSAVPRGFLGALYGQNPKMFGGALEVAGVLSDSPNLVQTGQTIQGYGEEQLKQYEPDVPSIKDVGWDPSRLASYAGYALGQGVGTSLPSVGFGLAGTLTTANPIIGAAIGAVGPSYALNLGDVYTSAKEDQDIRGMLERGELTPKQLAGVAAAAAIPVAALDMLGTGKALGIGTAEAKRTFIKSVLRGALIEGGTEGAQEYISQTARQILGSNQPLADRAVAIIDNMIGGAIPGAAFGAVARAARGAPAPAPKPIEDTLKEMTGPPASTPEGEKIPQSVDARAGTQLELPSDPPPGVPPSPPALPVQPPLAPGEPPEMGKVIHIAGGGRIMADEAIVDNPVFYSRLVKAAEDKLPNAAPAAQMLATLRNQPGVKQGEIDDTGLETFLNSKAGKVTKSEILEYLEENGTRVETVESTGVDYGGYTAPGNQQAYHEFRLVYDPRPALGGPGGTYAGPHWNEPNVVAHVRATTRVDKAGQPVLHIEEIQSDLHQLGREVGYLSEADVTAVNDARGRQLQIKGELESISRELNVVSKEAMDRVAREIGVRPRTIAELEQHRALSGRARDLANARTRLNREYMNLNNEVNRIRTGLSQGAVREVRKPPPAPFRSNWVDLSIKRMIRWAADNGYSKISWQNPQLAIQFSAGGGDIVNVPPETAKGLTEFYGKIVPSRMKAVAKEFGGVLGVTDIDVGKVPTYEIMARGPYGVPVRNVDTGVVEEYFNTEAAASRYVTRTQAGFVSPEYGRVFHITIPESAKTFIQRGLALYDRDLRPGEPAADVYVASSVDREVSPEFSKAAARMTDIFNSFAKKFGFDHKVSLNVVTGPIRVWIPWENRFETLSDARGAAINWGNGRYEVWVRADMFNKNIAAFYATMMHEFGHVVVFDKFAGLPSSTKLAILGEYQKWKDAAEKGTVGEMLRTKRPAALLRLMMQNNEPWDTAINVDQLNKTSRFYDYHLGSSGFDEWFADQVSRWATSTAEPLTIVEKAFAGIGKALRLFFEHMTRMLGVDFRPTLVMQNWLNSFLTTAGPMSATEYARLDLRTQKENQYYVADNVPMPPQQPDTQPIDDKMKEVFNGNVPPQVKEMRAHADRINWFYKWMAGLMELVAANPRFTPLLRYAELANAQHREESQIQDYAVRVAKMWRGLGAGKGSQGDALVQFLDELTNMTYLTNAEKARGVVRHPTPQEIQALARRVGLNGRGAQVAANVRKFFTDFLQLLRNNAMREANKITDVNERARRVDAINAEIRSLGAKPYFPFMRFGRHYVQVKNAAGTVIHFQTFERTGFKSAERQQQKKYQELKAIHDPIGDTVEQGMLPEEAEPFIGLPPNLLAHIKTALNLTPSQQDALEQLSFQMSPALSFKHHFQHKRYVPGYSMDFMRAFSRYAFHGARYYARAKYAGDMRDQIRAARAIRDNKSNRIADWMSDHLQNTVLDAKGDYGIFKGAIFFWTFGFFPAGATQNMTQTPMVTLPYLGSKFGDLKAMRAITRAMTQLQNFYRKGSYEGAKQWEMQAITWGIKTGRISETQAPELAGLSQGGTLLYGNGGNKAQRAGNWILEKSAGFFELAEQWNRRIAFRAALELATANPNAAIVKEAMSRYPTEYQSLVNGTGDFKFTPAQAQAIVTANHVVEQTQFVYARYARPRFMRGRIPNTIFVFKRYIQGLIFLGLNNPSFALRYLLLATAVGGLGGVPGAEDLKGIIEALLKQFGYEGNIERQFRRFVLDHTGDNPPIPPDVILHGMARRGMGVPALLDMLGSLATGRPGRGLVATMPGQNIAFPVFDRSKAISPGPILPIEFSKFLDPTKDTDKTIAEQTQRASGAVFSVAFNIYKAIMDNHLEITDAKRWERAIPRELAAVSKTWRTYSEGRDRYGRPNSGSTLINYDVRDTEQLMEVVAQGLGYNNLRMTARWDEITAQNEYKAYIETKRNSLYEQYHEALKSGSKEELDKVRDEIRKFNVDIRGTPARGYAITAEKLMQSIQGRERVRVSRERGIPIQKSDVPIAREMQRLFPESVIDVRRVR